MSTGITRPNGSIYRPRKIRAQMLGNEDETNGVVVLGTHDLAVVSHDVVHTSEEKECRTRL